MIAPNPHPSHPLRGVASIVVVACLIAGISAFEDEAHMPRAAIITPSRSSSSTFKPTSVTSTFSPTPTCSTISCTTCPAGYAMSMTTGAGGCPTTLSCYLTSSIRTTQTSSSLPPAPTWGQCGGIGWTGSILCGPNLKCVRISDFYSEYSLDGLSHGTGL